MCRSLFKAIPDDSGKRKTKVGTNLAVLLLYLSQRQIGHKKNKLQAHHFGRLLAFIFAIRAANYNMSFIKLTSSSDKAKH